jgi:lipopolysaccharide biosynthesis protein
MKRCLILAHYDPSGAIDPHVIHALKAYREYYAHIIMVSVSASTIEAGLVDQFIKRENVGYDFYSYKTGLESLVNIEDFDEITFANDSIYGPFYSLQSVFSHKIAQENDVWGLVASNQFEYHLQSWFVTFKKHVIASDAFHDFWQSVSILNDKMAIIKAYEVGLTPHFEKAGFSVKAIYHNEKTLNQPMRMEAAEIFKVIPFVKVIYIREYPTLFHVIEMKKKLRILHENLYDLMVNHAKRTRAKLNNKTRIRTIKHAFFSGIGLSLGAKIYKVLRGDK